MDGYGLFCGNPECLIQPPRKRHSLQDPMKPRAQQQLQQLNTQVNQDYSEFKLYLNATTNHQAARMQPALGAKGLVYSYFCILNFPNVGVPGHPANV
jgi:hypothetical protein